jgi:hypothetical protein
MMDNTETLQTRLQILTDLEIDRNLPPEHRLLLAVLQQAVLDYFLEPVEWKSSIDYFALSPIYQLTLSLLGLPNDALPDGVDPIVVKTRREQIMMNKRVESLQLEMLVRQLSANQLKVLMTMGLMHLPASAGKIAAGCQLSRKAVQDALGQLSEQGLVERVEEKSYQYWSLPVIVAEVLSEILAAS